MHRPNKLFFRDMKNTESNFNQLLDEYNNLVEVVNELIESNNSNYRKRLAFKKDK